MNFKGSVKVIEKSIRSHLEETRVTLKSVNEHSPSGLYSIILV